MIPGPAFFPRPQAAASGRRKTGLTFLSSSRCLRPCRLPASKTVRRPLSHSGRRSGPWLCLQGLWGPVAAFGVSERRDGFALLPRLIVARVEYDPRIEAHEALSAPLPPGTGPRRHPLSGPACLPHTSETPRPLEVPPHFGLPTSPSMSPPVLPSVRPSVRPWAHLLSSPHGSLFG